MKKKDLFIITALFLIAFNLIIHLMADRISGIGSKTAILLVDLMTIVLFFLLTSGKDSRIYLPMQIMTGIYIVVLIAFIAILNKLETKTAIIIHIITALIYLVVFFILRSNSNLVREKLTTQNKNYSFVKDNYSILSSISFSSVDDSIKEKIDQLSWLIKSSPNTVSEEKRKYEQSISSIIERISKTINNSDSADIEKSIEEAKSLLNLRNH